MDRIDKYIQNAHEWHSKISNGGCKTTDPQTGKGWFYEPTILDALPAHEPAVQEEIFGPVQAARTFDCEDTAVSLANDTEYGNVAGIYTQDNGRELRIAHTVYCGQVAGNDCSISGIGRGKGLEALDAYIKTKGKTLRI